MSTLRKTEDLAPAFKIGLLLKRDTGPTKGMRRCFSTTFPHDSLEIRPLYNPDSPESAERELSVYSKHKEASSEQILIFFFSSCSRKQVLFKALPVKSELCPLSETPSQCSDWTKRSFQAA